jgi:hypothetical protein
LSLRTSARVLVPIQKTVLDLRIDFIEPLLGALGLLPVCFNLGLKLSYAILSSPKMVGKPLRRIDRMSAVLLGTISSFVQKLEDRMTGSVELSVVVSRTLSRSMVSLRDSLLMPFPIGLIDTIAAVRHGNVAPCGYADFSSGSWPIRHDFTRHRYMDTPANPPRQPGPKQLVKLRV